MDSDTVKKKHLPNAKEENHQQQKLVFLFGHAIGDGDQFSMFHT